MHGLAFKVMNWFYEAAVSSFLDCFQMLHSALSCLKSNVWRRFGFYKKARKLDKSAAVCKHSDVIVLP